MGSVEKNNIDNSSKKKQSKDIESCSSLDDEGPIAQIKKIVK